MPFSNVNRGRRKHLDKKLRGKRERATLSFPRREAPSWPVYGAENGWVSRRKQGPEKCIFFEIILTLSSPCLFLFHDRVLSVWPLGLRGPPPKRRRSGPRVFLVVPFIRPDKSSQRPRKGRKFSQPSRRDQRIYVHVRWNDISIPREVCPRSPLMPWMMDTNRDSRFRRIFKRTEREMQHSDKSRHERIKMKIFCVINAINFLSEGILATDKMMEPQCSDRHRFVSYPLCVARAFRINSCPGLPVYAARRDTAAPFSNNMAASLAGGEALILSVLDDDVEPRGTKWNYTAYVG